MFEPKVTYNLVNNDLGEWLARRTATTWYGRSSYSFLYCPYYTGRYDPKRQWSSFNCPIEHQLSTTFGSGDSDGWSGTGGTRFVEKEHARLAIELLLQSKEDRETTKRKRGTVRAVIPVDIEIK